MHAPSQLQADFLAQCNGIGADLHFLVGGDTNIGPAQVRSSDPAACQQRIAGQTFSLEGAEYQRHGIEGGEMGMQHERIPAVGNNREWSKLYAAP